MAKKFKIAVRGQHEEKQIVPLGNYEYNIRAENHNKAENLALTNYQKIYPDSINVNAKSSNRTMTNMIAIIFMSTAFILSLTPFHGQSGGVIFSLKPGLFTTLIAIGLYSAVIVRIKGLHNSFISFSDSLLSIMTILFCASFLNIFIGDITIKTKPFFLNDIVISGKIILFVAVLLSWLGIKAIAGIVWVIVFIIACTQMIARDVAMGIWGSVYIISAFLGIFLQLKQMGSDLVRDMGREFINIGSQVNNRIFSDIDSAAAFAKRTAGNIKESKKAKRKTVQ